MTQLYLGIAPPRINPVQAHLANRKIRPPAVAGQFYPANPQRLRAEIAKLLASASTFAAASPKALIVPHAGYAYSGPIAATAFVGLQARAQAIKRVLLIGPAHYVRLSGIAVPTADAFETPLGLVPLDRDALGIIGDLCSVIEDDG